MKGEWMCMTETVTIPLTRFEELLYKESSYELKREALEKGVYLDRKFECAMFGAEVEE